MEQFTKSLTEVACGKLKRSAKCSKKWCESSVIYYICL